MEFQRRGSVSLQLLVYFILYILYNIYISVVSLDCIVSLYAQWSPPPIPDTWDQKELPDCTGCPHFRGRRCTMKHSESFQCHVSLFRGVGDSWVLIRGELLCGSIQLYRKHCCPINASNELNLAKWAFCGFRGLETMLKNY